MSPTVATLDPQDFSEALKSTTVPLVIDFWAPWCVPCQATIPVFHQLADEFRGRAAFASLNIDLGPAIARDYSVHSISTILVLRQGWEIGRAVGA